MIEMYEMPKTEFECAAGIITVTQTDRYRTSQIKIPMMYLALFVNQMHMAALDYQSPAPEAKE